jgi:UDP:flavonoid glycosyltransferase YjiC (YdhE family)
VENAFSAICAPEPDITTSLLLIGKPLLLPGRLEQFLLARRVEELS